ncbi:MAG: alpha/beta hydrolase [Euryarchaeota archaeon]|nr:alpha/beta hydrolase [Euryarchaeota archaeon]MDE1836946.1 alpha/beta hydrolase [Euryarchaeota archaeon]MDE2045869.1 alpha/beta hydrolase [Thermoplasmata archaeon]
MRLFRRSTPPVTDSEGRAAPGSIASLTLTILGGVPQGVLVRGRSPSNPALLILHGGPGGAYIGEARSWFGFLENEWVVVNWDQRGAGLSHTRSVPPSSLTGAQLAEDAKELVAVLRARFGVQRFILMAHSFGTVVAPHVLHALPDAFERYIAVGPTPTDIEAEMEAYRWTLARARELGRRRAVAQLERIGPPPYRSRFGGLDVRARWTNQLGGAVPNGSGEDLAFRALREGTENTWGDLFFRVLPGTRFWMRHLDESLSEASASDFECPVPLLVVQGTLDRMSPPSATRRTFERWKAPSKRLLEIEGAGHYPFVDAPERFREALR